jgi:hypothetical protein
MEREVMGGDILIINGKTIDCSKGLDTYENTLDDWNMLDNDDPLTDADVKLLGDETKDSGLQVEHKLAYLFEMKAARAAPGESQPSPDPGATRLREYWVHGEGAAKIQWGVPHDYDRCVDELSKYVGDRAHGLCNIYHREALGVAPGQEGKASPAGGGSASDPVQNNNPDFNSKHPRIGGRFAPKGSGSTSGSGAQQPSTITLTPADQAAIKSFQKSVGLPQTGQLDKATVARAQIEATKQRSAKGSKKGKGTAGKRGRAGTAASRRSAAKKTLAANKKRGVGGTSKTRTTAKSKTAKAGNAKAVALHQKTMATRKAQVAKAKAQRTNAAATAKAAKAKTAAAKAQVAKARAAATAARNAARLAVLRERQQARKPPRKPVRPPRASVGRMVGVRLRGASNPSGAPTGSGNTITTRAAAIANAPANRKP